jgi:hypothetical protein
MKSKDYIIIGSAIAIYLLWKNSKTKTTTKSISEAEATVGGNSTMPTSNEPEQVYGLNLPTGMDLPVLTAGTGVSTETGVQQGLGNTTPTPVVIPIKEVSTEDILILGGIKPIKKNEPIQVEVLEGTPIIKQEPKIELFN